MKSGSRILLAAAAVVFSVGLRAQVNIVDYGAVGDGVTDGTAAINNAIAAAKRLGTSVFVPAGTFAYSDVLVLDGVQMQGTGPASALYALNYSREAILLRGNGPALRNIKLTGVKSKTRYAEWEKTRIAIFATNFVVDGVTIDGSAAGGIQTAQASHGQIVNSDISNTLADSIQLTYRTSFVLVQNNRIRNSGDDGIAVVSYMSDGGMVHDITARNNLVLNNLWGRNMSVVGGTNILYENNFLQGNPLWACLYIAQESSSGTYGAHNVAARYNTLKNCGSPSTHAAVMIYSDDQDTNTNVSLVRNDVTQAGQTGVRVFSNFNQGIVLDSNRIRGANPDYDVHSADVRLIPYASGPVGYMAPSTKAVQSP
jgi:hypothetical protein